MIDIASEWILNSVREIGNETCLWIIDENIPAHALAEIDKPNLTLMTNRYDLFEALKESKQKSFYSDFDFSIFKNTRFDKIFYRISKEKAVVHHIANQARLYLKPQGKFIICGYKNEGIKTFCEKISIFFGERNNSKKIRDIYHCAIGMQNTNSPNLDDYDYQKLRPIADNISNTREEIDPLIFSKPGQFGWNKLDTGSQLLITELTKQVFQPLNNALDLGCGYGFLTINASQLNNLSVKRWVLTDNNAAAITAATENCRVRNLNAEIIPANCANSISDVFDLILCNPPFHQGFDVEGELTDLFLTSTKRLLKKNGFAYFVVNQFIPLERKASELFSNIELLASDGRFKVIRLSKS